MMTMNDDRDGAQTVPILALAAVSLAARYPQIFSEIDHHLTQSYTLRGLP
jgi:hypothetical protein